MFYEHIQHIPLQLVLFFILYGITGVVPLIAAVYLLLRRGNAFAPDTTPPLRLRRWTTAFFGVAALGHVWWLAIYVFSDDIRSLDDMFRSVSYVAAVLFDSMTLLATIVGMLLAMLQDRRRPVWPVFVAMTPFVALGGVLIVSPNERLLEIAVAYILLLYAIFSVYVTLAVRQYGRWLRDNYADLERKEVWLTHVLSLVFMLLFILYAVVDTDTVLIYLMHAIELILFGFLLWRVETLPQLDSIPAPDPSPKEKSVSTVDLEQIERLLKTHCVDKQLYLQHDLSLQQLALAVGTNRSYLSQYFSRQGITYNTYINNLRINHFISRYQALVATGQTIVAQELAYESGFSSYRTFSRAFTQRMDQSVTTWMGDMRGGIISQNKQDSFLL